MKFEIGEAAKRAGVRASAVRYYEKRGLIAVERGAGGRRIFSTQSVERLVLIRYAKSLGFSLVDIRKLISGYADGTPAGQRWADLATAKLDEVDSLLRRGQSIRRGLYKVLLCQRRPSQSSPHAIGGKEP